MVRAPLPVIPVDEHDMPLARSCKRNANNRTAGLFIENISDGLTISAKRSLTRSASDGIDHRPSGKYKAIMQELGWEDRGEISLPLDVFIKARSFGSWLEILAAIDCGEDSEGKLEAFLAPCFRRLEVLLEPLITALRRAAIALSEPLPTLKLQATGHWIYSEAF